VVRRDPARQQIRLAALHDLEHGGSETAAWAPSSSTASSEPTWRRWRG
jgi:hypothetical protein